jgi:hypothetical protein
MKVLLRPCVIIPTSHTFKSGERILEMKSGSLFLYWLNASVNHLVAVPVFAACGTDTVIGTLRVFPVVLFETPTCAAILSMI